MIGMDISFFMKTFGFDPFEPGVVTPPRNRGGVIFSLSVCLWRNTHFSSLFSVNFPTLYLNSLMFDQNKNRYVA